MIVGWRITPARFANPVKAAFDGEGSFRWGGRWSRVGDRVCYASSSLALAALEYFVNLDAAEAPELVAIRFAIPDGVRMHRIGVSELPSNWHQTPAPESFEFDPRMWKRSWRLVESVAVLEHGRPMPTEPGAETHPPDRLRVNRIATAGNAIAARNANRNVSRRAENAPAAE